MLAPDELLSRLSSFIDESEINNNPFFESFKKGPLDKERLGFAFQQYYYYIRTFPQILAGLSHRVESEEIRYKLARTVCSELGDGQGAPHFRMFEDVMESVGIKLQDYRTAEHIAEAEALVEGLREIFLSGPTNVAVGGHYAIEETGLPMIHALYEGFRHYGGVTVESMAYFYLHLFLEAAHVDWIADAVRHAATDAESIEELERGTTEVIRLLSSFWAGLHQHTYAQSSFAQV